MTAWSMAGVRVPDGYSWIFNCPERGATALILPSTSLIRSTMVLISVSEIDASTRSARKEVDTSQLAYSTLKPANDAALANPNRANDKPANGPPKIAYSSFLPQPL